MKQAILAAAVLAFFSTGLYAVDNTNALVTVNGQKITRAELNKKLTLQYGAQGLSELIDEKLLVEEAGRLKISVDPKEVEARFKSMSANIEPAQFEKNLKTMGWTPQELRDLLRRQLLVRGAVIADKKIAITDEDAQAFFDKNKERFATPESIKLSQIFVAAKADADEIYQALSKGEDFAKLSALKSSDPRLKKNNGSLGYVARGMLLPDIEKVVFALKPGEYSNVLATGNGYSIFMAGDLKPAQEATFDGVKEKLKSAMFEQTVTKKVPELAAELRQKAKIEVVK